MTSPSDAQILRDKQAALDEEVQKLEAQLAEAKHAGDWPRMHGALKALHKARDEAEFCGMLIETTERSNQS